MKEYLDLLKYIMENGEDRPDRTGTGTRSVFGYEFRCNLAKGFPLLTTKKMNIDAIIYELLWFLRGSTNIAYLKEHGVHIWDANADEKGNLGPVYGKQWRHWEQYWIENASINKFSIDQIANVIKSIKEDPFGRRHIVSAWNVADIDKMRLPPCHLMFQFYVHMNKRLSCHMYQRSADSFLGVPFNISSYALLTMMIAQICDLMPGNLIISFGDVHIYKDHFDQVNEQLTREPKALSVMAMNEDIKDIDNFDRKDFVLKNYYFHPAIRGKMSV